jgi:hypothetical protein
LIFNSPATLKLLDHFSLENNLFGIKKRSFRTLPTV